MSDNKFITHNLKLRIPAANAKPGAPINQILGQYGIKIADFCKEFNDQTKHLKDNTIIPVNFKIYNDRSYKFDLKTPHSVFLLKKVKAKNLTDKKELLKEFYEIARLINHTDKSLSLENRVKILINTYKSIK